jgi:hypothetical protein
MLQLINKTLFEGFLYLMPDPDGIDSIYTAVKATYHLGKTKVVIAEEQLPIATADRYHGDPSQSSLEHASDVSLMKTGTDVLLLGNAHAPEGKTVTQSEVSLAVGSIKKTILVFGNRVWRAGLLGPTISSPETFQTMPLIWEKAFGGTDQSDGRGGPILHAEARNPVGSGFRVNDGQKSIEGLGLPNLENLTQPIRSWRDRPTPSCFGPVCPHWEPRRSYAGTYDDDWLFHRAPYLPKDFDARFFQLAPPDQVVLGHLRGGEPVEIRGATASGVLRFNLPEDRIQTIYRLDNQEHQRTVHLDTVLIEPDYSRLVLLWRSVFPCDKKALRVREVKVATLPGARK